MVSCTINLKILLVGDIQYLKGMYNSEIFFITVCLGGVSWKTITTFIVLAGWLVAKEQNSELYMPFGYCMSPTSNIFRFIVHDTIMTERFCSHYRVIFSATQKFGQFQIRNWPSPPQFEVHQD